MSRTHSQDVGPTPSDWDPSYRSGAHLALTTFLLCLLGLLIGFSRALVYAVLPANRCCLLSAACLLIPFAVEADPPPHSDLVLH